MSRSTSISRRVISIMMTVMLMTGVLMSNTCTVNAETKLKLTPASKTMYIGNTATFKSNKKVTWTIASGKSYIKLSAKKNKSVKVKALKSGTAYVKAKAGKTTKKIKIVVKPLLEKSVNRKTGDIGVGQYCNVTVNKSNIDNLAFTSSDENVAEVTKAGLVKGKSAGDVTITATDNGAIIGSISLRVVKAMTGEVNSIVDLSNAEKYPAGKTVEVWIPIPKSNADQDITNINYSVKNATVCKKTKDSAGNTILYVKWDKSVAPENRVAKLSFQVYRMETVCDSDFAKYEKGTVDKAKFKEYLKKTSMSGSLTKGKVKDTADTIVKDAKAKTVYDKARAIYIWMTENLYKRDDSKNFLTGDVLGILRDKTAAGCQDVNSVFVALCNAVGIPAREVFGLKIPAATPKCHVEFYLPGYGWAPCDAYDAIKAIQNEEDSYRGKDAPKAEEWKSIQGKYWGYREEGWIAMAMGRDITLDPAVHAKNDTTGNLINGKINIFMCPYAEYDGEPAFSLINYGNEYTFTYTPGENADCGC